tara:strand:+ start:159 stop:1016 length:858 start_codon:yes stop_codon:yes gene_type:complete
LKNILGIGSAGCNVAKRLGQKKQYKVYSLSPDVEKNTKYNCRIEECPSPEDFENKDLTKVHKFLSTIEGSCVIFLCGASNSSAITLRALESLHKRGVKMEVVYFKPEVEVLSEVKRLNERTVRHVLQEYARSGLFEKITLVENTVLEQIAGSTNVFDYFDQINHVFTETYHMINVFSNTKPITSTFAKPHESCRISTIGLGSLEKDDLLLFPIKQEVEVVYYFGINEEKLRTEENLFRTITDKVKSRITDETKVSFGIYPTQYEDDYIYVEYFSPKIQQDSVDTE